MLGTMVAGRYSAAWNAVDIGYSRQGFNLEFQFKHEAIAESDLFGLSTTDLVLRGADVHMDATLREWKAGSTALLWMLGAGVLGKVASTAKPLGDFASNNAQALVLTSTANTPAAAAPATLTALKAWMAENYNPKILLDSRLREIPIRLIFLPYLSATDEIRFSTT